jgi:flagellin-like hook-associated protein FlgL
MARVLAARDAAASAAGAPKAGEKVTVPRWLINTNGQNTYPPVPLIDVTGKSVPSDPTLEFDPPNTDAGGSKPYNPPLTGQQAAGRMLSIVLDAINRVSSTRGELGAIEGRFTSNIANLTNVVENLTAARSRIMDADIAAETANLTKLSILQQAGTAILTQANQLPQLALQLLK